MKWYGVDHRPDCLMVRYVRLSFDAREWWPPFAQNRNDLCSCGAIQGTAVQDAANADAVTELREYIELFEGRGKQRGP